MWQNYQSRLQILPDYAGYYLSKLQMLPDCSCLIGFKKVYNQVN